MYYYSSLFTHIRRNKGNIAFAALVGGVATFLFLVFVPQAYKVQTDYLIIQQSASDQDFYTLSKSAEYSGNVLKEAILSNLFLQEVAQTDYFKRDLFSGDEKDQLKKWRKTVDVQQRTSAGILQVNVAYDDRSEAVGIARAISEVLINKNELFRSGDPESLSIKLISGPIVEQNPTASQLIMGVVAGLLFGSVLALLFVWYREEFDHTDYSTFSSVSGKHGIDGNKVRSVYEEHLLNKPHWSTVESR